MPEYAGNDIILVLAKWQNLKTVEIPGDLYFRRAGFCFYHIFNTEGKYSFCQHNFIIEDCLENVMGIINLVSEKLTISCLSTHGPWCYHKVLLFLRYFTG